MFLQGHNIYIYIYVYVYVYVYMYMYIYIYVYVKWLILLLKHYTDVKVHTIRVDNRKLFWVKICDVQAGLGVQNMSDLVRKERNLGYFWN